METQSPTKEKPLTKRIFYFLVAIICSALIGSAYIGTELYKQYFSYHKKDGIWQSCFTPNKKCQQLIIETIDQAKESINLQGYSFSDPEIVDALIKAHQRNVHVQVILDNFNLKSKKTLLQKLIAEHICVRIDKPEGVAHNKIVIIDDRILITGSYNFSTSAYERNTENVLVIHDHTLAGEYLHNWQKRWEISTNPSQMGCRVKLPSSKKFKN